MKMHCEEADFSGNTGWQWRFCKRQGICNLSLRGVKLSADKEVCEEFVTNFTKFIKG
jgi:hypothetical protein